jgi:hypothetical protein
VLLLPGSLEHTTKAALDGAKARIEHARVLTGMPLVNKW